MVAVYVLIIGIHYDTITIRKIIAQSQERYESSLVVIGVVVDVIGVGIVRDIFALYQSVFFLTVIGLSLLSHDVTIIEEPQIRVAAITQAIIFFIF